MIKSHLHNKVNKIIKLYYLSFDNINYKINVKYNINKNDYFLNIRYLSSY